MKRKEIQLRVTISYPEENDSIISNTDPAWILEDSFGVRHKLGCSLEDVELINSNA